MFRVLLLRQPRSGLPGLKPDDRLLARVPVYGTQDAGRGFWKKFRRTLIAGGVRENRVLSAVYTLTVDSQLRGIVATHVDDLLYAFDGPVGQGVIGSHQAVSDLVEGVRVATSRFVGERCDRTPRMAITRCVLLAKRQP